MLATPVLVIEKQENRGASNTTMMTGAILNGITRQIRSITTEEVRIIACIQATIKTTGKKRGRISAEEKTYPLHLGTSHSG